MKFVVLAALGLSLTGAGIVFSYPLRRVKPVTFSQEPVITSSGGGTMVYSIASSGGAGVGTMIYSSDGGTTMFTTNAITLNPVSLPDIAGQGYAVVSFTRDQNCVPVRRAPEEIARALVAQLPEDVGREVAALLAQKQIAAAE